ncbi:MAG: metallophosphoesterase [Solirubrobacterales bacterium]|nr:metallophosphoesterase [Solirubrobacterales bacterium]
MEPNADPNRLRLATAGDIHCNEERAEQVAAAVNALPGDADIVLLAGDLTTHGKPEQAKPLAEACAALDVPVLAVLGNHDWHADRVDDLAAVLADGGITLLDGDVARCQVKDHDVGVVGVKGFIGGFSGSHLPDFGEPILRELYSATSNQVEALERGLAQIELCTTKIVLLHYAPTVTTIQGENPGIWAFLGSDRLAAPIAEHEPDIVLHGHAHSGTFAGQIGPTPVYNVAIPVTRQDFWLMDLELNAPAGSRVH